MEKRKERIDRGIKVRSDGIYALNSYREFIYLVFPRALPIVGLLVIAPFFSAYWKEVIVSTASYALLALSWEILYSTGMISLGQSLFYGVGSYIAGSLNFYYGLSPWITIPIATIFGGFVCTLMLLPVLRLRGIYFAMVTLVLPMMFPRLIEATRILGGTDGLTGLDSFENYWISYYLIILVLLSVFFGFRRLIGSDYGLVIKGINDNDRAIMSSGINIYWYKAQVLFLAGAVGCFAGAYGAHYDMFTGMPVFALDYSILPVAAAAVGGIGSFAGPLIGTFILVPLSELMRALGALRIVFYGLFLVIAVVGLPEGIFHFIKRKYEQKERWVKVG